MNKEFKDRRKRLGESLLDDSIVIVASSFPKQRNSDADYPYRQDSNFLYLSGYSEPESVLVILPGSKNEFVIFCRDRDSEREQWDGFRSGQEGAIRDFGADESYSISQLHSLMPELLTNKKNIYYSMSADNGLNQWVPRWLDDLRKNTRAGIEFPENIISLDSILHEMRLIKSPTEIELMKKAGNITCEAHTNAMEVVKPGMFEYQLEAEYLYTFSKNGARFPAYNSIVGGGNNSCILHYNENNSELFDGDLVLVDAGCEFDHYASDVTRTFPVGRKFTEEQKLVYEVVFEAHKKSMEEIKPGNSWNKMHEKSVEVITDGLIDLGLLKERQDYSKFYMHRIGHWLGMDVHDVGNYKKDGQWRELEPGMVMTIEPGIYILDSLEGIDPKWLGIGIRIEDDVLVTDSGFEILTPNCPRDISDIENLKA